MKNKTMTLEDLLDIIGEAGEPVSPTIVTFGEGSTVITTSMTTLGRIGLGVYPRHKRTNLDTGGLIEDDMEKYLYTYPEIVIEFTSKDAIDLVIERLTDIKNVFAQRDNVKEMYQTDAGLLSERFHVL